MGEFTHCKIFVKWQFMEILQKKICESPRGSDLHTPIVVLEMKQRLSVEPVFVVYNKHRNFCGHNISWVKFSKE